MEFKSVVVVGAGTMGNGIAQVFAQKGYPVLMIDVKKEFVDRGLDTIKKSLERLVKKEKIKQDDMAAALGRIKTSVSLEDARGFDLAVEAAFENLEVKKDIFRKLDAGAPDGAILASNTSSISITKLAAGVKNPENFIGMHFMNPVPLMQLVEVVKGIRTSQATVDAITGLSKALGKTPVLTNDAPGFVSNRVLLPMINEAAFALMEGVATREAIDEVMKLGMNHPMGPLALADLIGLDVCLSILNVLNDGFGDPKYRPCPLLKTMVDAGFLGRKSGRGFFEYK